VVVEVAVEGAVAVDEDEDEDEETDVEVGIETKDNDGFEEAILQNCCARFSEAARSPGHPLSIQPTSSGEKSELTQKQSTSTTLEQFTLAIASAKQFVTHVE